MLGLLLCFSAVGLAAEPVMVDFAYLQSLNEDCIGWLYQPESGLNQPVMQHETDDWYHERAFDNTKVYKTGSVYLHAADSLSAQTVVLHGQAREEGCLSILPQWQEQAAFDHRSPFRLLTPEGDYEAVPFACMVIRGEELGLWLQEGQIFESWLRRVQECSLVKANADSLPSAADRLLVIAGHHLNGNMTLVLAKLSSVSQPQPSAVNLTKMALDAVPTLNGMVDAGPAGQLMYYAQNDPVYDRMRYESAIRHDVHRDFGGGGCAPTAMAIIAANLVDAQKLPSLGWYALDPQGTLFCACSVNRVYCDHTHVPYQLKTVQEYLRYLPIAMGDFAAGNNAWEFVARRPNTQGTNIQFVDYVCDIYDLSRMPVSGLDAALDLMKQKTGEGLMLTGALRGSPYTNNSHFVVLAGVDEEYMYILDPLRRTEAEYAKTDSRSILEVLSPGVTRIRLEDRYKSDLSPMYYITAQSEN